MQTKAEEIKKELKKFSSLHRKKVNEYFFKTGVGEYGQGDIFIGVSVPNIRKVAKKYFREINFSDLKKILQSKIHEERLLALIILVYKYEKSEVKVKKNIFSFYLKNLKFVNNWDLVDVTAPKIVGNYLASFESKNKKINIDLLLKLAKSKKLWEKRIAIVSCLYFITKNKSAKEVLEIAEIVKQDKHDLLQKALGWMLREVYKNVDESLIRKFLEQNIQTLPRTTLRYAIEKMDILERKSWLNK